MGQANSRSGSSSSSTSPPPTPPPPQCDSTHPSTTSPPPSGKSSRRLSLRRTVRSLLPHSRPTQDRSPLHDPPSIRERWRSSSRFSNPPSSSHNPPDSHTDGHSPLDSPSVVHDNHQDTILEEEHVIPEVSSGAPILLPPSPSIPRLSATDPSSNPLSLPLSHSAIGLTPHTDPPELPHAAVSSQLGNINTPLSAQDDIDHTVQIERDFDEFLASSQQDKPFVQGSSHDGPSPPPPPDSPPDPHPEHASLLDPHPQPSRHFQSPGPLVVVQGVVNTSDNPAVSQSPPSSRPLRPSSAVHSDVPTSTSRTRSASAPRTSTHPMDRSNVRSRLSAFIPRPSSMLNRHPSTSDPNFTPSYDSRTLTDASSSLQDSASDAFSSETDTSAYLPDPDQHQSSESDNRTRPLSPGSIDVLGTLLSVAAAATAASLFSPSLGFQANTDTNVSPPPGIPRPMSPTPTAGLGGGEGFGSLPGFGLDYSAPNTSTPSTTPQQPREGRERIRNVWESFRERLGLNRNVQSSNINEESPQSSEEQGNMRPGEIMLAEMARALNIGLGLNGDSSNTTSLHNSDSAQDLADDETPRLTDNVPTGRPLPPEDSFERFLLNLQADLRAALSDDGISTARTSASEDEHEGHVDGATDEAASSRLPLFDELPMRLADDDGDDEPPPLDDVSENGEDEEGEEEGDGEVYEDTVSTRTPTPMPASTTVQPNRVDQGSSRADARDQHGNADRGPPGINLWRLYRFQPIPASQVAGHAATTTSPITSSPTVPSTSTSPTPYLDSHQSSSAGRPSSLPPVFASTSPSTPSSDTGADGADSTPVPTPAPPAGDASLNMVVPVIVVGLQSVDMGQVQGHAHPPESDAAQPDSYDADRRSASTSFDEGQYGVPVSSVEGSSSGATTPRGRRTSWQSRAATALRNLRPGRRNGAGGQRVAEGTGSRTFLIYVIGGYYPPDHHMVTGSDNLDSYEALWELAELLGQVKPPVATREDIDKSGLQVIKSSDLEEYERLGKLASNCVERCLICLDDYTADDELRLMTCKHAFHRDCVDKWLQVGRNNCPACRTKGVATAGEVLTMP